MSTARLFKVNNETGGVLVVPEASVTSGIECAIKVIKRTIAAEDVGVDAGQTGNASGALCFTPVGDKIIAILGCTVIDKDALIQKPSLNVKAKIDANGNLVIRDSSADQADLPAEDIVYITILVGNQ